MREMEKERGGRDSERATERATEGATESELTEVLSSFLPTIRDSFILTRILKTNKHCDINKLLHSTVHLSVCGRGSHLEF